MELGVEKVKQSQNQMIESKRGSRTALKVGFNEKMVRKEDETGEAQ